MTKIPYQFIKLAHECANQSGKIIKRYFRKPLKIGIKKDSSPVTKADIEVEKVIRNLIKKST